MNERIPAWALRVATGAVVAALVAWSFWQRWQILAASPFPIGVDGYFYPIQVRALLDHGALQYPASPLAFWWMAPFAAATDPIVGVKLAAALGVALIAVPAFLVGARLGHGRGPGLVAAAIATTSASSTYLSIEFVKQGIGLTVALTALWLVLRAIETRTRARWIAAGAGIVAALLTHKVAAAIVILVGAPAAIAELRGTGALRGRRLLYMTGGAIAAAILMIVLGIVFPQSFLSIGDLGLVGHTLTAHARWSAPALVAPGLTLVFGHEALIAACVALVAGGLVVAARFGVTLPKQSLGERTAISIVIGLALAIGLPWLAVTDPQGLGFRLRIAAFVPLALCAAFVIRAALDKLAELPRDAACLALAGLVVLHAGEIDRTEGQVLAHPALVTGAMALEDQIPAGATVIVPERHVAFMIAWYTRAPVSLRPEPIAPAQRVRLLLPLSSANYGWPLEPSLEAARREPTVTPPIGVHPRHRNGLVLVTEATWQWMLDRMPAREQRHFAAWPTI